MKWNLVSELRSETRYVYLLVIAVIKSEETDFLNSDNAFATYKF